jgi:hypothetical protein
MQPTQSQHLGSKCLRPPLDLLPLENTLIPLAPLMGQQASYIREKIDFE